MESRWQLTTFPEFLSSGVHVIKILNVVAKNEHSTYFMTFCLRGVGRSQQNFSFLIFKISKIMEIVFLNSSFTPETCSCLR